MTTPFTQSHRLARGALMALTVAPETLVRVAAGRVWITTSESPDDLWLDAGASTRVSGRGLTVIEAVEASTVEIGASPATPSFDGFSTTSDNARRCARHWTLADSFTRRAMRASLAIALSALTALVMIELPLQAPTSASSTQVVSSSAHVQASNAVGRRAVRAF